MSSHQPEGVWPASRLRILRRSTDHRGEVAAEDTHGLLPGVPVRLRLIANALGTLVAARLGEGHSMEDRVDLPVASTFGALRTGAAPRRKIPAAARSSATQGSCVSHIVARWRVWEAAHFSRLLKTTYGVSPRAYRDRALGDKSRSTIIRERLNKEAFS